MYAEVLMGSASEDKLKYYTLKLPDYTVKPDDQEYGHKIR